MELGMDAMGMGAPAPSGGDSEGLDPTEDKVIKMLEQIAQGEPDTAKSAALTDIIAKLYKLLADEEDMQMKAMGGDPKQLRTMSKAYASQ